MVYVKDMYKYSRNADNVDKALPKSVLRNRVKVIGLILIVVTRIEKKGIRTFCVIIIWNKLEVNVQKAENVNMCKKYITKRYGENRNV